MVKRLVVTSLLVSTFIFSGCSDNGEGEDKLAAQQMLDQGDYQGIIDSLGDGESASEYMLLGAAYMGRAGVGMSDLIQTVIESSDSNDDSVFGGFVDSLSEKTKGNPDALVDLQESSDFYNKAMDKDCSSNNLTTSEKDVCLFSGLSQTVKAATTISYIADDVSVLSNDDAGEDAKLTASACAMEYAADRNITGTKCTITINNPASVTFKDTNKSYDSITVNSFEYLLAGNSPAVTKGFCQLSSFDTFQDVDTKPSTNEEPFYVCPVDRSSDANTSISITKSLVDALNDGTDSIGAAGTEETKESIDEFKCEVLGGTFNNKQCTNANINDDVTEQNVIDYLNDNNK